jgi:hypothetical protein
MKSNIDQWSVERVNRASHASTIPQQLRLWTVNSPQFLPLTIGPPFVGIDVHQRRKLQADSLTALGHAVVTKASNRN